ncbi:MAG: type II toxin-antitoxin system prevent-host-death family antitoxin [Solirubrobacteraceae bacterium]
MAEVGIRALKQNASAVVAAAAAGEIITITDRGRPVAQLIPLPEDPLEAMIASGQARPPKGALSDLPEALHLDGPKLSELIAADRADQRY